MKIKRIGNWNNKYARRTAVVVVGAIAIVIVGVLGAIGGAIDGVKEHGGEMYRLVKGCW